MIGDYFCTGCGEDCKRDLLTVKKATFLEMGAGAKTVRSRVTEWLCPNCLVKDVDWKREAFQIPVRSIRG